MRALWLATFVAALLHCGLCLQSPHGPDAGQASVLSMSAPDAADGHYHADDDGGGQHPERDGAPGHRHHQAVLRAPSLRSAEAGPIGQLLVCLLPCRPCGLRLFDGRRVGDVPVRAAGAALLTRLGISRT